MIKRSSGIFQTFAKINVTDIVKNHFSTLKDYGSSYYSKRDILLFILFPIIFSVIIVSLGIVLDKDLIGVLINVFAIFVGLLFNLLILIYDVVSKVVKSNNHKADSLKISILEQIYSNISFEVLLSLLIVLLLAPSILLKKGLLNNIFSAVIFSLVILFSLTLLMVLKRVHKLLSNEIESQKKSINGGN